MFINTYLVTREYGGPEEGGWYYDQHTLTHSRKVARRGVVQLGIAQKRAELVNQGRRPIYSVISEGRVSVYLEPKAHMPMTRPRYE